MAEIRRQQPPHAGADRQGMQHHGGRQAPAVRGIGHHGTIGQGMQREAEHRQGDRGHMRLSLMSREGALQCIRAEQSQYRESQTRQAALVPGVRHELQQHQNHHQAQYHTVGDFGQTGTPSGPGVQHRSQGQGEQGGDQKRHRSGVRFFFLRPRTRFGLRAEKRRTTKTVIGRPARGR